MDSKPEQGLRLEGGWELGQARGREQREITGLRAHPVRKINL